MPNNTRKPNNAKKKPGPKPLPEEERRQRSKGITICPTLAERATLELAARKADRPLAVYCREAALKRARNGR